MNFLTVVYLFTCANLLIFIRITKVEAAGNLESEIPAKSEEEEEQSSSVEKALKDPAQNALLEELSKIYKKDEHSHRSLNEEAIRKIMDLADNFINNINPNAVENFMQHSKQELLNLCRRAWIMDLLRKTKPDIETVKKYENLFQVKENETHLLQKNCTLWKKCGGSPTLYDRV